MTEHTAGPWVVDGPTVNSESYDCYYIRDKDGTIIAEICEWGSSGEMQVDAALIAAAPELLSNCKAALAALEVYTDKGPALDSLREAIAKAEEA